MDETASKIIHLNSEGEKEKAAPKRNLHCVFKWIVGVSSALNYSNNALY